MFRGIIKVFLLLVWLIFGALIYGTIAVRIDEKYLPPSPSFLEKFIIYAFQGKGLCCEDWQDIEFYAVSFYHISVFTLIAFICYCAYKHFRNKSR